MEENSICAEDFEQIKQVFGSFDEHIRLIEQGFGVSVVNRDCEIKISGEAEGVQKASRTIQGLMQMTQNGEPIDSQVVRYVMGLAQGGSELSAVRQLSSSSVICLTNTGKPVKAKTLGQKRYVEAIRDNAVVFGVGPAGTGKTYLAVAMAVRAFKAGHVQRIILTRPAVEAGESLGFLPGDLQTKVDPYLRPLYDALFEMFGEDSFARLSERGAIEVAPLAYMRGRTLNESFIILDEAQNTTPEQMKMFLTRLGAQSQAVVTGDITQIDLPSSKKSGLVEVIRILKNVENIAVQRFSDKDVIRSKIVQDIIRAYEKYYQEGKKS